MPDSTERPAILGAREDDGSPMGGQIDNSAWDALQNKTDARIKELQRADAARDAANAKKSVMREAAFEKCKPLISGDNAKMQAFSMLRQGDPIG